MTPTARQRAGFLGTLLASIDIPLAMKLLGSGSGEGLSVPKKAGRGLALGPKPGMMPFQPPPYFGD